ncbi:helix-turn-helix transcriptional regulator [Sutcliffiella halmapala]|uniref:helix-turn-helix transcriptional regulator n=1 Tax=Sutcliffiella halmapala TaxID=79882 RepID=UPI000994B54E|nr:helix-turn-helix transcriptional regulator [Sutcliffiella halmapala]
MNDPLKGLKKAMNKTVFRDMRFSEKQQENILNSVGDELEANIEFQILKSLEAEAKAGFSIYKYLQQHAGREVLNEQEGKLYILLHQLEKRKLIRSMWLDNIDFPTKFYDLEKKGKDYIRVCEKEIQQKVKTNVKLEWNGGLS